METAENAAATSAGTGLTTDLLYDKEDVAKVCRSLGFQYDVNPGYWISGEVTARSVHSRAAVAKVSIGTQPGWAHKWAEVPMGTPARVLAEHIWRA